MSAATDMTDAKTFVAWLDAQPQVNKNRKADEQPRSRRIEGATFQRWKELGRWVRNGTRLKLFCADPAVSFEKSRRKSTATLRCQAKCFGGTRHAKAG